eukprot:jgi/Botrbrau1/10623/Bobra.154_1s0013.1
MDHMAVSSRGCASDHMHVPSHRSLDASSTLSSPCTSRSGSPCLLPPYVMGGGLTPSAPPLSDAASPQGPSPGGARCIPLTPDTSRDAAVAMSVDDLLNGDAWRGAARPDTSRDAELAAALQRELAGPTGAATLGPAPYPGAPPVAPLEPPQPWSPAEQLAALCSARCMGCRERMGCCFGGRGVSALGGIWHPACFTCGLCKKAIGHGKFVAGQDGAPYHADCYREKFTPRCTVCHHHFPVKNGQYRFMRNRFWKDQVYCEEHQADGTPCCCACERLEPRRESKGLTNNKSWVQLPDGRHICLACLESIVVDTDDAQPLYNKVLAFYAQMGMPLPTRPPLMLVEVSALNEAEVREGRSAQDPTAPAFHTRGLTLMQEYREIRTVVRQKSGPRQFYNVVPHLAEVKGPSTYEVTAILVLHGLPWLLTGAILAHEVMHAWLRLSGVPRLSADVEEGLCQLMALLWLEAQPPAPEGEWDERLASFFAHHIRTHSSPIYGDGFRAALEAFQSHGLPAVLASVRATGSFPQ